MKATDFPKNPSSSSHRKRKFSPIRWDKDTSSSQPQTVKISRSLVQKLTETRESEAPELLYMSTSSSKLDVHSNLQKIEAEEEVPTATTSTSKSNPAPEPEHPVSAAESDSSEKDVEANVLEPLISPTFMDVEPPPATISSSRWAVSQTEQSQPSSPANVLEAPLPTSASMDYDLELNQRELEGLNHGPGEEEEEEEVPQRPESSGSQEGPATLSSDEDEGITGLRKHGTNGRKLVDMLQGCRSVECFERLNRIDEGTYGVVYRARDKATGEVVALKKVKMDREREGFPLTSLREINILLSISHPSIVGVREVAVGGNLDAIFMVMEFMEHDLKGAMEAMKVPFSQSEVKCLMLQLLEGTHYLHDNWVLHRDLKTSNILLNNRGELKICDFGLARQYGSPLKEYTHTVVTLWYRAPELLLGSKLYSIAIDMWSLGCIMAELLSKEPLFNGKSEIDQIDKIFKVLGTPNERIWPDYPSLPSVKKCNFMRQPYNKLREKFPAVSFGGRPALSEAGFDLLNKLLTYDPNKRITAADALKHGWFREVPLPKEQELMPTFPSKHEQDRRLRRLHKSPDPIEERRGRIPELGSGGLFG